jgi:hypothetical protein
MKTAIRLACEMALRRRTAPDICRAEPERLPAEPLPASAESSDDPDEL